MCRICYSLVVTVRAGTQPMKPEISRTKMSAAERNLRNRAAQLLDGAGILHGTLVERQQRCGSPTCHCVDGERHRALVLTVRHEGVSEQIYVPHHLEATVRRWVKQDHAVRDLLAELAHLHAAKLRALKSQGARSSDES